MPEVDATPSAHRTENGYWGHNGYRQSPVIVDRMRISGIITVTVGYLPKTLSNYRDHVCVVQAFNNLDCQHQSW